APDIVAGASGQFAAESPYKNIEEAYGSYMAPVGEGLQFDVGKFVTNAGAEVIEAKDDWNYTRSLLFQLAIPFYHTGVRMTFAPNSTISLMANYDYTTDTCGVIALCGAVGRRMTTQGIAGYLKYQANKWFAVVPRIEWFKDGDAAPWATGTVQNLTEATVTL